MGLLLHPASLHSGNGTTVNVAGQWANYASTFTPGTGTVNFNGSGGAQSIIGSNTFYKLNYSNSSGLSLSGNTTINNTITFPANGLIEPNGNVLLMGASATTSGSSANAYVDGNLSWAFTSATNHAFPVGNGGIYLPVTFAYTSTPTSSTVTIGATSGSYPPAIPANVRLYPSAYWTVSQTGASAINYGLSIPKSGFTPTGTVVILKSDNGATATSNATTGSGPYVDAAVLTTIGSTNSQFALGQTNIPLTITGVTAQNKVYDGTTTATLNTGSAALSGVVSPDDVSLVSSGATGTFASKNVANGITVTTSGFTLGGAQAAYYSLTQPTTTANITAATVSLAGTRIYDGTTNFTAGSFTPTITGMVGSETLTIASGTGTVPSPSVSAGTQTLTLGSLALGNGTNGGLAANYTLVGGTNTGTITVANSTISVTGATTYTYNGAAQGPSGISETGSTGAQSISYSGTDDGSNPYGPSATAPTNAGSYTATATVAADANYSGATSAPYPFTIAQATATINVTGYSVTYDGNAHTATGTATGVNSEDLSSLP